MVPNFAQVSVTLKLGMKLGFGAQTMSQRQGLGITLASKS
jgi:hypothetical protein